MNPYSQNVVANTTHNEYQSQFAKINLNDQVGINIQSVVKKASEFFEDRVDYTAVTYLLALSLIVTIPFLV